MHELGLASVAVLVTVLTCWVASVPPNNAFPAVPTTPGTYQLVITPQGPAFQAWQDNRALHYRITDAAGDTVVSTEPTYTADTDTVDFTSAGKHVLSGSAADGLCLSPGYTLSMEATDGQTVSWSGPHNVTTAHTTTWPAAVGAVGTVLVAEAVPIGVTGALNTSWGTAVSTAQGGDGNFTTLLINGSTVTTYSTSTFLYNTASDDMDNDNVYAPADWAAVTVGPDEVVRFKTHFVLVNAQAHGSSTPAVSTQIRRDGVVVHNLRHAISHTTESGGEYVTNVMDYYDDPGPGTYAYDLNINAPPGIVQIIGANSDMALFVEYNPDIVYDDTAWV